MRLGCVCLCFYIQFLWVWFSVLVCFLCLGCFSFYAFRLHVFVFIYSFYGFACFRLFCSIVCEWMPRLLMGGHFDKKKFQKRMSRN